MTILSFNETIYTIEQEIDIAKCSLYEEKKFPYQKRSYFNFTLLELLAALNNHHAENYSTTWHAMHHFVKLKNLAIKIEKIRGKILEVCPKPYFANKIKYRVLPLLENKQKELKLWITSQERLPFSVGTERSDFHKEVREILHLQNQEHILRVANEFFHLLADRLEHKKLKGINKNAYTGSLEIFCFESWIQILNEFVKEVNSEEKIIGNNLLSILKRTLDITAKISFATQINDTLIPEKQAELNFFDDLTKSLFPKEKFASLPEVRRNQFLKNYRLGTASSVPQSVIINEIVWDILEAIKKMQGGEVLIFPVGTFTHSIVVQLSCIKAPSESDKGEYQYKIFNTGSGAYTHHQLDRSRQFAYPLIFSNLNQDVFSYKFFAEIVRMTLDERNVHYFYDFHDRVLAKEGKGQKHLTKGTLYPLQRNEICVYSAMEAWIDSFLTKKQSHSLELIKTKIAVQKQTEVVKSLKFKVERNEKLLVKKWGSANSSPVFQAPRNKLKENVLLLQLGQQYLNELINRIRLSAPPALLIKFP